ncbi:Proteasome-activating nucleotidase [uncultured archaeon]|nr:Proteasome-activating nucleotidase [uncultured archaeon]
MRKGPDVDLAEMARATEEASGADLKAIVVEAGMNALRRNATTVSGDDFEKAVRKVLGDVVQGPEEAMRMFS